MHCDKYGISATSWLGINTTMDHIGEKKSTDKIYWAHSKICEYVIVFCSSS